VYVSLAVRDKTAAGMDGQGKPIETDPGAALAGTDNIRGHILIVDDDPVVRDILSHSLSESGYRIEECVDGDRVEAVLQAFPADIVLLDIRLPGTDGLTLTRRLRASSDIGIILVTRLDDEVDRIVGLEIGADDYIAKPFNLREVRARVSALMRRIAANGRSDVSQTLRFGTWSLNLATQRLRHANGEEVRLTPGEYQVLACLVQRPQKLTMRDHVVTMGSDAVSLSAESLDVLVSRLRRKLGDNPRDPQLIQTVHGQGYVFVPTPY
jgi:DNA-binding response OmpR family regulator